MFCPNCGNNCGDAKFCTACGTQLKLYQPQPEKGKADNHQDPPFALKKVRVGYLAFEKSGVRLHVKLPRVPQKDLFIPYDDVYDVSFVPAKLWLVGFLCIRCWNERHKPIPKTSWQRTTRDSLIWFEIEDNADFYRAYQFLQQCAINNNQ